jgi:hypothetical protein
MTRHRAIIRKLGGHVVLADHLGLDAETVKSWKADRGIRRATGWTGQASSDDPGIPSAPARSPSAGPQVSGPSFVAVERGCAQPRRHI